MDGSIPVSRKLGQMTRAAIASSTCHFEYYKTHQLIGRGIEDNVGVIASSLWTQTEKRSLMKQPENTKSRHEMIITLSKTLILLERRTNVRQRSRLLARQTSILYLFEWFPWLPGEHSCPRLDLSPNLNSNDICEGNMSPTREIMMLDCSKKERKEAASSDVVRAAISTI